MRTHDGEALEIDADNVFINAGARPANPPIEGLDNVPALMMGNLPYTALRDSVFAHPTLAESLNSLFSTVEQR